MIRNNTPWEVHRIGSVDVLVKRDDLSVTKPGPALSKMRGIYTMLMKIAETGKTKNMCVVDDGHSLMGWGVARACKELGLTCYNFYPLYKSESTNTLRYPQQMARDVGATMIPLTAGRFFIMYGRARAWMAENVGDFMMVQDTSMLDEGIIEGNAIEASLTPMDYRHGTWILPTSKATSSSGVIKGLGPEADISYVVYVCNAKDVPRLRKWMLGKIGFNPKDWAFMDEGIYQYEQGIKYPCPFPCSPYYDLKAWKWLVGHVDNLEQPIVFWNIGS